MPRPRILVSAHTEPESSEFPDAATSLSRRYSDALVAAGAIQLILAPTTHAGTIADAVQACDGVLLSGGEDVAPALYTDSLPVEVRATVVPAVGGRDLFELSLIHETLRRNLPLLAICRGQQILNVALGGDLVADLPLLRPEAPGHSQCHRRFEVVHEVVVTPGSRFADITGTDRFGVNSTHHQAVGRVAPPLRATGHAPDGTIEALEFDAAHAPGRAFLLAVQFHPERLHDQHPPHSRIFQAFTAACQAGR